MNLEAIVDKWILYMHSKSRALKDTKFEKLDIKIIWDKLSLQQDDAIFEDVITGKNGSPQSQTLFETFFYNMSNTDQEFSLRTERKTRQSTEFSFTKGFSQSKELNVSIKIPYDIVEVGGGIKREQSVECGKTNTYEEEFTWGLDNVIRVPPKTRTHASLVIDELELERNFHLVTYLKGKLKMYATMF